MSDEGFDINPDDFAGEEGLANMAKMGLTIYRALKRDSATDSEAFAITASFFAGMTKAMYVDDAND